MQFYYFSFNQDWKFPSFANLSFTQALRNLGTQLLSPLTFDKSSFSLG